MARITGLNHVTLAVSDLSGSLSFYRDTLSADLRASWQGGAYLELGDLWLCLAEGPVHATRDYSHIALSCSAVDFPELAQRITAKALLWQDNSSEGDSLYFLDPDGHRLELHVGNLVSRLQHYAAHPDKGVTLWP